MLKNWLYFLLEKDGRSLHKRNGVVSSTAKPTPLPETPEGWQDISIGWERNMQKVGAVRNFSVPLGFVGDAADIIRDAVTRFNIEREIFLLITRLFLIWDALSYGWRYKHFYKGELDLSTFKDDGVKVICNISEGALQKKLKAGESTVFELDIDDDPEAVTVLMDGMELTETQNWLAAAASYVGYMTVPLYFLSKEGAASGFASFDVPNELLNNSNPNYQNSNLYFCTVTQDLQGIRIRGTFTVNGLFYLMLKNQNSFHGSGAGASVANLIQHNGGSGTYEVDFTFNANAGDKFFLVGYSELGGAGVAETKVRIDFQSAYPETFCKGLTPETVLKRLGVKMFGEEGKTASRLLQRFKGMIITSGDALRVIPGAKLKTSFISFAEFVRVIMAGGQSIEKGQLIIEAFEYFLNKHAEPIPLGKVKNLEVTPATDLMASTIKVGYNERNIDNVNGKSSFNNTHSYTTPVSRVSKEYPLICPYTTEPFKIEPTRVKYDGMETTDNSADNEVFVIHADMSQEFTAEDGTRYYKLLRLDYNKLEGVPNSTVYNIEGFTPKRIMEQHRNWFNSMFYGFAGQQLKFQTTERNAELYTEWQSPIASIPTVFDEDADFTIGTTAIFLPWYLDFDTEVPADLVQILEETPNRPFSVEWQGHTYQGYLMKAAIQPETGAEQSYRLLLTPNNDLSKLLKK